jgi:hypothetical protein
MIDEHTLDTLAAEFNLPRETVAKVLEDAERKPGVTNPIALGRAWLRKQADALRSTTPTATSRRTPDKPFVGFDASGSCFRSETPVTNPQTEFARWIVREMRDQLLTPADVVRIARTRDREIWQAIGVHTLMHWNAHAHWTRDDRNVPVECQRECDLSCWASLQASSGLAECIRSFGGWYPWANDREAWAAMLARDTARRHAA